MGYVQYANLTRLSVDSTLKTTKNEAPERFRTALELEPEPAQSAPGQPPGLEQDTILKKLQIPLEYLPLKSLGNRF